MSELIHNLGIEWKVLLAQIINFTILLFLLKKFAYKPILKILDERKKRIDEAIEKSRLIENKMKEIDLLKEGVLSEARKQSQLIIAKAEEATQKIQEETLKEARLRSEKVVLEAQKKIELEREKILQDVKQEVASLVMIAVEKTVGDVLDESSQEKMVREAVKLINSKI